jgi:hypothetical protein
MRVPGGQERHCRCHDGSDKAQEAVPDISDELQSLGVSGLSAGNFRNADPWAATENTATGTLMMKPKSTR